VSSDYSLPDPHTNLFNHTPLSACLPACLLLTPLNPHSYVWPLNICRLLSSRLLILTPGSFPVLNLFTKSSPEGKVKGTEWIAYQRWRHRGGYPSSVKRTILPPWLPSSKPNEKTISVTRRGLYGYNVYIHIHHHKNLKFYTAICTPATCCGNSGI
jgi:hypothetical protein